MYCNDEKQKTGIFHHFTVVRFGRIMALKAKQDVFPGDEITVNYGYKVKSSSRDSTKKSTRSSPQLPFAPPWFQDQWFHHVREVEEWNEAKIKIYCSNVSRRWGHLSFYICGRINQVHVQAGKRFPLSRATSECSGGKGGRKFMMRRNCILSKMEKSNGGWPGDH